MDNTIRQETPLGTIIAKPSSDPSYPGIWVELRRTDAVQDLTLVLIEFIDSDGDVEAPPCGAIVTRVWGDAEDCDYTDGVFHVGIERYFAGEECDI